MSRASDALPLLEHPEPHLLCQHVHLVLCLSPALLQTLNLLLQTLQLPLQSPTEQRASSMTRMYSQTSNLTPLGQHRMKRCKPGHRCLVHTHASNAHLQRLLYDLQGGAAVVGGAAAVAHLPELSGQLRPLRQELCTEAGFRILTAPHLPGAQEGQGDVQSVMSNTRLFFLQGRQ